MYSCVIVLLFIFGIVQGIPVTFFLGYLKNGRGQKSRNINHIFAKFVAIGSSYNIEIWK